MSSEPHGVKAGSRGGPASGPDLSAFQASVGEYLIRHRSVLDVLARYHEACARVHRAVTHTVTACGCVQVQAGRQSSPPDIPLAQLREHMQTHVSGDLCEACRDELETQLGRHLFYLAGICQLFGLRLDDVLAEESKRVNTLGIFYLS